MSISQIFSALKCLGAIYVLYLLVIHVRIKKWSKTMTSGVRNKTKTVQFSLLAIENTLFILIICYKNDQNSI